MKILQNLDLVKKIKEETKFSIIEHDVQEINWIELFRINKLNYSIGVSESGYWSIFSNQNFIIIDSLQNVHCLLSMLELNFDELANVLKNVDVKFDNKFNLIKAFPFSLVIYSGLIQLSDYWIELALEWNEKCLNDNIRNYKDALETIANSKAVSQDIRHKCHKLLNT